MIGATVAGYRILEKLGEGGMGVVYKAVDTSLDRVVAIKVLGGELARNPELEQRFRAEAKAQASLNHVNLATLYAFLVKDGSAWMVMEYIEGETFAGMIERRGPIPAQEAVPLFRQALLGLGYAHRMGIVHRDIKPGNIMVNRQGIVKVMDFGIAKVLGNRGMTRTGTQMGTAWYMAPEQVTNKGVDIRSDIYALGITLYEMLSGHVPFESDSDYQVMTDHVNTPPPPPTQFYPYIPQGVVNAVLKALAKDPGARFQTTEEFGAALEQPETFVWTPAMAAIPVAPMGAAAVGQAPRPMPPTAALTQPPGIQPPPPPVAPAPGFKLGVPILIGLVLGVVLLAGGALYLVMRPHPKPVAGTSLAPLTGSSGNGGGQQQIDIPNAQVPASPGSTASGKSSGNGPPGQVPPNQQQTQTPSQQQYEPLPPPPSPSPQQQQAAPAQNALLIPAGTPVTIRTIQMIESEKSYRGQKYDVSVDGPIVVGGQVVVPRGANAQVEVVESASSGHFKGRAQIELRLVALAVRGRYVLTRTDTFVREGSSRGGTTAKVVGGAAAVGGLVGGIFHRGRGAAEGAAAGAGAGAGVQAVTRSNVDIPPETRIVFRLRAAVQVP